MSMGAIGGSFTNDVCTEREVWVVHKAVITAYMSLDKVGGGKETHNIVDSIHE